MEKTKTVRENIFILFNNAYIFSPYITFTKFTIP